MLILKIILSVAVGLWGFYVFLSDQSLDELKKKITKDEKNALEKVEATALITPLILVGIVWAL